MPNDVAKPRVESEAEAASRIIDQVHAVYASLKDSDSPVSAAVKKRSASLKARKAHFQKHLSEIAKRPISEKSKFDPQSLDEQIWGFLEQASTYVIRPTGIIRRPLPDPVPGSQVSLVFEPKQTSDYLVHGFAHDEGKSPYTIEGVIADLLFGIPALIGWQVYSKDDSFDLDELTFDFSNNIAAADGIYVANVVILAWGEITAQAHTTSLYPARSSAQIYGINGGQPLLPYGEPRVFVFGHYGTDINYKEDFFSSVAVISTVVELTKGQPIPLSPGLRITCEASGDGAVAEINMLPGIGGMFCVGCTLDPA